MNTAYDKNGNVSLSTLTNANVLNRTLLHFSITNMLLESLYSLVPFHG